MIERFKTINTFEKIILAVGIIIIVVGFYLISKMLGAERAITWNLIQSLALWSLLVLMLVLTDSNESIKEELKVVIGEHKKETQQLKKISAEMLQEIKLLGKILGKKKR